MWTPSSRTSWYPSLSEVVKSRRLVRSGTLREETEDGDDIVYDYKRGQYQTVTFSNGGWLTLSGILVNQRTTKPHTSQVRRGRRRHRGWNCRVLDLT